MCTEKSGAFLMGLAIYFPARSIILRDEYYTGYVSWAQQIKDRLFSSVHKRCEVVGFGRCCRLCLDGEYAAFFGTVV